MIRRLGIENTVQDICGSIGVTGSTRDLYWCRLQKMVEEGRPSATLYWRNGRHFFREQSQEEWNAELRTRESDLNWIDENAMIVPAEGAADPHRELRKINESIGQNFLDDMLAAHGSGRLLLCQDQGYRIIAERSLGVAGSWLQPLLMVALHEDILSREEYNSAVIALVGFGDWFVSIDCGILLEAARHQTDSIDNFSRCASLLGGENADISSHIGVAVEFLGSIWPERAADFTTAKQTSTVLENLLRGRGDWPSVVGTLRGLFQTRFGGNAALDRHILSWLQGHFLVSFGASEIPHEGTQRNAHGGTR